MIASAGASVGKYRIERTISRSTNTVYEGIDPVMSRHVAIKEMVPPDGLSKEQQREWLERFECGTRSAGSLTHPNIVTILGMVEEQGRHYLLMEYLEGGTIREALDRYVSLPIAKALWIALQASDALAYAHSRGIVHGDIKPANVHVLSTGQVKVTDFCIAAMCGQDVNRPRRTPSAMAYLAPEQLAGGLIDGRADVFSLGGMLYEMVTGKPPFAGETAAEVARSIASSPPPMPGSIPDALQGILQRAMAADPADRYGAIRDMAADLRRQRLVHEAKPVLGFRPAPNGPTPPEPASDAPMPALYNVSPEVGSWPGQEEIAQSTTPAHTPAAPAPARPIPVVAPIWPSQKGAAGHVKPTRRSPMRLAAVLAIGGVCVGAVIGAVGLHRAASARALPMADNLIYQNGIETGWTDGARPRHSGYSLGPIPSGRHAIAITVSRACAAVYFHNTAFDPTGYKAISFWIDGGKAGCYNLWVQGLTGPNLPMRRTYAIAPLAPNAWVHVEIPLSSLGMDNTPGCDGFQIVDESEIVGQRFSLNGVSFEKS